jgi:hypothetical protein
MIVCAECDKVLRSKQATQPVPSPKPAAETIASPFSPAPTQTVQQENNIREKNVGSLKIPAITLMVGGGIIAFIGLFTILLSLHMQGSIFASEDEVVKLLFFKTIVLFVGILLIILSGFIITSSIFMLQHRYYAFCVAGAICAIVGWTIAFPLVVPFAIWTLIALRRAKAKRLFL